MPKIENSRFLAGCLLLISLVSAPLTAATITDAYVGSRDYGWGDVIGDRGIFDIDKAVLSQTGDILTVEIFTDFAGQAGNGFGGITGGKGIGYGDLFLSASWNPYVSNTSKPENGYLGDDYLSGTRWSYGFSLDDDRWENSGVHTGSLYDLTGYEPADYALLSSDFLTGGTYRRGQEVAVRDSVKTDANRVGIGNWTVDAARQVIQFEINIAGTGLDLNSGIALHWGMSCGNDVIEGRTLSLSPQDKGVVTEPGTALLLLIGAVGVAGRFRRAAA